MKTTMTLGEIRHENPRPCTEGWKKLIAACGTSDDDHVVDLRDILRSNGPRDAWWATRSLPRSERVALALRAARTVEHTSPAAKKCNAVTERWLRGEATDEELRAALAEAAWAEAEAQDYLASHRGPPDPALRVPRKRAAAWAAARAARAAAAAAWAEAEAAAAEAALAAGVEAEAEAAAWDRLGEIMRQWCDEQDEEVRR
jgi:hypothetical protein